MNAELVARLTPLSPAERIQITCQLADEYYAHHPQAHRPGRRPAGIPWGFDRTLARLTGRSASSIRADVTLGRRLGSIGLNLLQTNRLTITQARLLIHPKNRHHLPETLARLAAVTKGGSGCSVFTATETPAPH